MEIPKFGRLELIEENWRLSFVTFAGGAWDSHAGMMNEENALQWADEVLKSIGACQIAWKQHGLEVYSFKVVE